MGIGMQIDRNNKTRPYPHIRYSIAVGMAEEVWEVRHLFYAAKHKGKYKLKDRYFASTKVPLSEEQLNQMLLDDTEQYIKSGRYSDYFFVERPIYYE